MYLAWSYFSGKERELKMIYLSLTLLNYKSYKYHHTTKARVGMHLKAYKFRIYPTKDQEILLAKTFGCCRVELSTIET